MTVEVDISADGDCVCIQYERGHIDVYNNSGRIFATTGTCVQEFGNLKAAVEWMEQQQSDNATK